MEGSDGYGGDTIISSLCKETEVNHENPQVKCLICLN